MATDPAAPAVPTAPGGAEQAATTGRFKRSAATAPPVKTVVLENVTPSQLVLRYLAMEGVTKLFGIPGAAVMDLLNELRLHADSFQYVICRQESGAAYIADGYARAGGGLGVTLVTSGPGATNALTGTMNAHASGTPVLTISGEVAEATFGLGYLQEGVDAGLDVDAVYRAATGYSALIDSPSNFATLFEQALRDALTAPCGASHISLPVDVSKTPLPSITIPTSPEYYRATPSASDPALVGQALDNLLAAQRPLILLGNGSRAALRGDRGTSFATFADTYSIPVMTTPEAKGVFPESHAMSLRNYGFAGSNWTGAYLAPPQGWPPYDALLVIGSALGELASTRRAPDIFSTLLEPAGPFMQIDLDASVIGRKFVVDIGIVAEAGAAIDDLLAAAANAPVPESAAARRAFVGQIKSQPAEPAPSQAPAGTVHPADLMAALSEHLPSPAHLFVDSGNCVGWCNAYLSVDPPTELHSALSMAPMGFAVGAVIGAKLAAPAVPCVAICGDGAFLMQGSELATAAQYGIGSIHVVLQDDDLTMVSQGMGEFYPGVDWTDYYGLGTPDLVGYATALGAAAVRVTSAGDLPAAIAAALQQSAKPQPQVIVVAVDPQAAPPYYQSPLPPSPS